MIDELIKDLDERMAKTVGVLREDLMSIRTGRASPSLVDKLMIDYYGTPTPLQQIAAITVPEAQQILIKPYSPSDIEAIEKSILSSDLGLSPSNDGQQIRLTIPALTEDRRRNLTKMVNKRAEEARIAARNIRRDVINELRDYEKESLITEDDLRLGQEKVQEQTDHHIKTIDEVTSEKDKEIMTI